MLHQFTAAQRRALAVLTVLALLFGAYFLRSYLVLMAVGAILAYLFHPIYRRLRRRMNAGLSATTTLLAATLMVLVPVGGILFLAIVQISQMINGVGQWMAKTDLTELGNRVLGSVNDALGRIPYLDVSLSADGIRDWVSKAAQTVGSATLSVARESVGGVAWAIASAIIFLYVFLSLLTKGDRVLALFRDLNPLGEQASDLYLERVGAMVTATVRGQFIIALCQGVAASVSLYIAGVHDGFFMFVIFLTALSFIPLGAGIVTIPIGIGMALFGNVIGGIFVVVFHLLVVTNIDNLLRPFLVPKNAHLDPALMLMAVFAGLSMFGFWGIVLGPVTMIIIVTTISVYREVYAGVAIREADDEDDGGPPGGDGGPPGADPAGAILPVLAEGTAEASQDGSAGGSSEDAGGAGAGGAAGGGAGAAARPPATGD